MCRWLFLVLILSSCGALSPSAWAAEADFTLKDLDGRPHSLSDYRGKWVVVNYWATWCPPCREEVPTLVNFHEAHKNKDAVVLGVNMEETTPEHLRSFLHDYLVTYPVLRGEAEMVALGPVDGLPTTYLVAPSGKVVAQKVGIVTEKGIESFMARYKAKKK